jgi:CHAT domain-containing protein
MLLQLAPRLHEFCAAPTLSQPAERRFAPVDWFLFLKTKLGWLIRSAILTTILCLCAGLTMAQTLGDDWQKLVNQYSALTKQNRYIDSLDVANKALALAEAKKKTDAPEVALSLLMLANSYTELNQFERALLYQQRGTTISEKLLSPNHPDMARLLTRLANLHQKMGQFDKAILVNLRALSIREKSLGPNHLNTALILNNLADNYRSLGLYDNAVPLLTRSVEIFEKSLGPDADGTAIVINNLAATYRDVGQYDKALALNLRALSINEKVFGPDHRDTASTLNYLGVVYRDLGQYEKALPLLHHALDINERILGEAHPDTAQTLNNLANAYADLARWDIAQELIQRSLAIHEKIYGNNHPTTAVVINNLARIYTGQHLHEKAVSLNQKALEIHEKTVGPTHPFTAQSLNILANTFSELGLYEKALPLNERALGIFENAFGSMHPETAQSMIYLAETFNGMRLNEKALSMNERAVSVYENIFGPRHRLTALGLNNLAINYVNAGQLDVAIVFMKAAVNSYQDQRERVSHIGAKELRSFTAAVSGSYQSLASALAEQGRLAESQMVLDMLKEDEQFDFVQRSEIADTRRTRIGYNATEKTWMERYRIVSSRLAALGAEEQALQKQAKLGLSAEQEKRKKVLVEDLRVAQKAFDSFLHEIRNNFARSGSARSADIAELHVDAVNELQTLIRGLGHDAVLLQYYVTEDQVGMLLTTPGVQLARSIKVSAEELNRQIAQFRRLLRDPKSNLLPASQALYQLLVAPVAKDLEQAGAKTVMLSLDGALRYLPFGVLHDGERYLVQRWNLPMYTSVTKNRMRDAVTPQWQVAGLGVTRAMGEFAALPAVKAEMNSIVKTAGGGVLAGEIHLDEAFTATRLIDVSQRSFQLLHVASHFRFSPGTEVNSFLLLGDGQQLTLGDIRTRNYRFDNVDLLTLSACDTGLGGGRDAQGREIEGFGVIAQQQGAKAVLATLWPVADQSTAKLMAEMYRRRQEQKLTKTEALRQAQLLLLSQSRYAHPFYWAPFILMGNWL